MFEKIKSFLKRDLKRPNLSDKILDKTILWMLPRWVTPNQLTILRFVLIPFTFYLLYSEHYLAGFIFFAIAAITDALDGALAWTRNMVTEWGQTYDPVADKLLIGSVAVLVVTEYISVYMTIAILAIEGLILANAFYKFYVEKLKRSEVKAKLPGKIKMFCQSVGIILLLINIFYPFDTLVDVASIFLIVSIFFGMISLSVYRSI
ncbi:CDP-alcohol phosphatidyltransferase family protein [Candidatus Nomurabacteria bacterium]|nr:CDP-alcohol phosphatidyltransferase family protein [Candidatus Nomurabacteria bacterium]